LITGSPSHAYTLLSRLPELISQIAELAKTVSTIHSNLEELGYGEHLGSGVSLAEVLPKMLKLTEERNTVLSPLKQFNKLDTIDMDILNNAGQAYISAKSSEARLDSGKYIDLFGNYYNGIETDTGRLLTTVKWLATVKNEGRLPESIFNWLIGAETARRKDILLGLYKETMNFWSIKEAIIAKISHYGQPVEQNPLWNTESESTLENCIEILNGYLLHMNSLVTWGDYNRVLLKAEEFGLKQITDAISKERLTPDQSVAIYGHAVFEGMAREVLRMYPDLAGFTRVGYEGSRERFAKIDRRIMENARGRISYTASQRKIPRGNGSGPVKTHTDLQLLARELQKQKRHIPIRQLVRRAGAALQALKPCFMMSPLSVAQYLDPQNITFDIVVMDEASQLKPEDALGAIARAKQLIVVGDPKQLPPTSFFDRTDSGNDEDSEEAMAIQDTESILDICMTTYNKRRLRWHYRSAHESLIAFSNNRFYDDDLIIFPSPLGNNCNYGVHRHYIEGATYQKGRNRIEAEAVALAVVEHFRKNSKSSLGVATFNREQAELVLDILDNIQKEQSWLEQAIKKTEETEEPFFVKNLENVQGDERDVIFVSTTYGPDPSTGKVFQRFGPIAGNTGWRRLNVIFTRAKKQLELFTSLRAADIKLSDTPSKGTLSLKEYLDYAETGRLPDYGTVGGKEPDSDFEIAVTHHLNLNGFKTTAQVGVAGFFIDIGVQHPLREGEFVLGVECDGETYHSAKSVRDRDRLRQEILEKKGWRIHRIWSTDWFKNRDKEVQRLVEAVRYAVEKSSTMAIDTSFQDAVKVAIASIKPVQQLQVMPLDALKKKDKDVGKKTGQPPQVQTQPKVARGLREELIEYRMINILPGFGDDAICILRDEILSWLIVHTPTTRDEFYKSVPMEMRQKTDSRQMQYIDDILEIIDGYAG
jgi:very-short-patch-repair endonuclease